MPVKVGGVTKPHWCLRCQDWVVQLTTCKGCNRRMCNGCTKFHQCSGVKRVKP
jgi:hypothetical protein